MGIVMNMSSYEIERDDAMEAEYGEEVLYSGWNPAVALACQQHALYRTDRQMAMPPILAAVDAEVFLQKMYACQR
jgi:hypothetical protein